MDFNEFVKGKHILIIEGYARQCLPFMRSFKKLGCEISLLCNSKLDLGYVSRFPDHKIIGICDPEKYDESEGYICNLIKNGNFDLVFPLVDFSARILSENKVELSKYAIIVSNDESVFSLAHDKLAVMNVCNKYDIPCPKTLDGVKSIKSIINLSFPIVIKPRKGYGARGFHCFNTENEILEFNDVENLSEYVVQEYIPQVDNNISVNIFIDNVGIVKSCFAYRSTRWFPLKGGTGTFNILVENKQAMKDCINLCKRIGLRGWVGIDLINDPRDEIAKVIEINPRVLACSKIGFDFGIDMGKMILQNEFGFEVEEQNPIYKDVKVRMSQTDILWFLKSPDRFRCYPSWFSNKNTKDQTFSWDDPLPWFAFLLKGLSQFIKEEEKRK